MKLASTVLVLLTVSNAAIADRIADQSAYAQQIERAFLDAGINATATVFQKPYAKSGVQRQYPLLTISGPINRVTVYQIERRMKIIDGARQVGFRMVDFSGRVEGSWLFDLSITPSCSRDFCF